jgi:solute carrier family 45, member 1/2/4
MYTPPLVPVLILVLIWNTTYTGEIYVRTYLRTHPPPETRREEDLLWDNATRIASFALLLESFSSLFANLVLPLFLRGRFAIKGLTLRKLWLAAHLLFAALMWSTFFISSVEGAVAMVATAGISWALTLWAPFALIAQCTSHINDISRKESRASSRRESAVTSRSATPQVDGSPFVNHTGVSVSNPDERRPSESTPLLAPEPRRPVIPPPEKKDEITSAGAIMGLHNVFISSPQFISTLLASVIFHFLGAGGRGDDLGPTMADPTTETAGGQSIAWVLRVGGLGGLIAAYLTWGLAEETEAFGQIALEN